MKKIWAIFLGVMFFVPVVVATDCINDYGESCCRDVWRYIWSHESSWSRSYSYSSSGGGLGLESFSDRLVGHHDLYATYANFNEWLGENYVLRSEHDLLQERVDRLEAMILGTNEWLVRANRLGIKVTTPGGFECFPGATECIKLTLNTID